MQPSSTQGSRRLLVLLCLNISLFLLLPAHASGGRPNVLWLIAEDMGQELGCYGYPIKTPNIDRLAREGTQFSRAFCSSPICSPSRSAFSTGMYATAIHAQDHRTAQDLKRKLPAGVKTIPKWFEQNGYHTSLMGNPKTDWNFLFSNKEYMGTDWSQRKTGQPFFAMYNFLEPHRWGWSKWPDLATHLDPDTVPVPPIYPDGPVMRQSIAKYMDFIIEMDRKVGLVLDRLEEEGLSDNTIIFFFGDNGRTIYRGKQWLYDEGMNVPLIARYPGLFEPGSVNDELISLIDLAPSSLSLAGCPVPEKMQGKVRFGEDAAPRAKYVFASRDLSDQTQDRIRAARDKRYKYIRNYRPEAGYAASPYLLKTHPEYTEARQAYELGELDEKQSLFFQSRKPEEELYDIEADPWETKNLAEQREYGDVLQRMRAALNQWITESGDVVLSEP
ncbi:MAG: sulfatase [Phycisphaeraceae bacterium]|nr:sulfatase [Phycisphaeraceae bacterium]